MVTQPPNVTLDGQPDRLSPGSRIRGANNMLQMSGALVGQNLLVALSGSSQTSPSDSSQADVPSTPTGAEPMTMTVFCSACQNTSYWL